MASRGNGTSISAFLQRPRPRQHLNIFTGQSVTFNEHSDLNQGKPISQPLHKDTFTRGEREEMPARRGEPLHVDRKSTQQNSSSFSPLASGGLFL